MKIYDPPTIEDEGMLAGINILQNQWGVPELISPKSSPKFGIEG